jgi:hypothetical protein
MGFDFKNFDPEFERVVEIYNAWGSSECTAEEGNTRPIRCEGGGEGVNEFTEGSIREALNKNCRFGFVAGGLDDRSIFMPFFDAEQDQYSPGMTGILAPTLSREALFEALYKRACYATTGERIIVGYDLAGTQMGEEISTEKKPGLCVNRHISGFVAGTDRIKKLEIFRNGELLRGYRPREMSTDFAYDDMDPLEDVALHPENGGAFVYYYIKVTQYDGHMAWGSPIWVDLAEKGKSSKKAR